MGAIPARYASTRLPGKPLRLIAGRPMIEHVVRRAQAVEGLTRVVVLTDDQRIADAVEGFGGDVEMTPAHCASGTDRIAWAARSWPEEAVVNIQGDEPLLDPGSIAAVAKHLREHREDPMVTLAAPLEARELEDPNAVKVVVDHGGYALYFSRAPIPWFRDPDARRNSFSDPRKTLAKKHIGIYGYQRQTLLQLAELPPAPLEQAEALEQLRALAHGISLRVLVVERAAPGVDTEEDLARVEALLTAS
ncbi:MAG: 3-deoxy-manno-octulosonate cytidylyltransferase [Acidobacteriota bacterium]